MQHKEYLKNVRQYPTRSESDAMNYIINNTNSFRLEVYDQRNGTMTSFFAQNPMGSGYLSSRNFARDYHNSLYAFIQAKTQGLIQADDIGGVMIEMVD